MDLERRSLYFGRNSNGKLKISRKAKLQRRSAFGGLQRNGFFSDKNLPSIALSLSLQRCRRFSIDYRISGDCQRGTQCKKKYQELTKERQWKEPLRVALSYSVQIVEEGAIAVTSNDVSVDALVSPAGVIPISPAAQERQTNVVVVMQFDSEEAGVVQRLVDKVLNEIRKTPVGLASYTVGLDSRVEDVMRLLDVRSNGVRVLGIHGMGGVGKTTLAKALFNRLVADFEHRGFISNVRETSAGHEGLVSLQNRLIGNLSTVKMPGTRCIQGIVLDFESSIRRVWDPSGERVSRDNFRKSPSFCSAVTYLKERRKAYLQNQAEKKRKVVICSKPLGAMVNLRLLQINFVNLEGKFKFLPAELKWLQWKGCPMKFLPSDFSPRRLAVLDLSNSKLVSLWRGRNKVPEQLMFLILRECSYLTAIPDLSGNRALEKIVLELCVNLNKLHDSVGNLNTLVHLNLRGCSNLIELPSDVSGLRKLENLILTGCSKLKKLPSNMDSMISLKELLLDETVIESLPESIFKLTKLERLSLNRCKFLKGLPELIGKLCSLKEISLNDSALERLPDSFGSLANLERLSLLWCNSLTTIPDSIGHLNSLVEFLTYASPIKELPASIGSLSNLRELSVGRGEFMRVLPDSVAGVVVSLNQQIPDEIREELPAIVDILAKILVVDFPTFTSALNLRGVPNTNEDQFHLCRYPTCHPLVSQLKEGYKIHVTRRDPPLMKGVELKKWGIRLVYEDDDDYQGDEESLNESQQSLSEKLAKFFGSFEEGDCTCTPESSSSAHEEIVQETNTSERRLSLYDRGYFISYFVVLPLVFLSLSWLWRWLST
ncbi:hypothetical protein C1H46_041321 [Malus baccata]|uniref:NB-ARC domain-containing protein n=1 Tax=Malus baccata TaxID=106549 RepID=A0A540KFZ9_MALBA|nr:hypothetical protein C1H46_041321 [Malus baccata]